MNPSAIPKTLRDRFSVLITCFNEQEFIGPLIQETARYNRRVLVVDDGSTDRSPQIIRDSGLPALFHARNCGKGWAVRTGLEHLLTTETEYILFMDGDGQHTPGDIPAFVDAMEQGFDFICGNRMHDPSGMPERRRRTNQLGSWALSRIINAHIPDTMVGFRMIRTDLLRRIVLTSTGFTIETEILLKCFTHRISYVNVPVKTIYHSSQDNKYQGTRDSLRIFFFCGIMEAVEKFRLERQVKPEIVTDIRPH